MRNRRDVRTDATPLFEKKRKCIHVQAEVNNYTRCIFKAKKYVDTCLFVIIYHITLAFEYNNIIVHSRWMDFISVVRRQSHELYTLWLIIVHMYTLSKYIFPERIILLYFPSKTLILSKSNGHYSLLSLCGNIN